MNLTILRIYPATILWVLKSLSGVPVKVFRVLYETIASGYSFVPIWGNIMKYCFMKNKIRRRKRRKDRKKRRKWYSSWKKLSALYHTWNKVDLEITEKNKSFLLKPYWCLCKGSGIKYKGIMNDAEIKLPALNKIRFEADVFYSCSILIQCIVTQKVQNMH